jgi:hypothetical protein
VIDLLQLASLSTEQLHVGDVPLFSSTTRAVFVNNMSNEHAIQFRWEPIRFVQAGQPLEVWNIKCYSMYSTQFTKI